MIAVDAMRTALLQATGQSLHFASKQATTYTKVVALGATVPTMVWSCIAINYS